MTIKKTRQLIDDPRISEEEVEGIRDECQALAEIIFDAWVEKNRKGKMMNSGVAIQKNG